MSRSYDEERARYTKCFPATADGVGVNYNAARKEELRTTPLVSLDVKHRVEDKQGETLFPQYALLGRHVGNLDHVSTAEPILMNTN
ncbi:hypothetical protein LTR33_012244, partial [Friedmanniomyces endolithicus]